MAQEALGVLGVIGDDVGAEPHFAARLFDQLTHLKRDGPRELVDAGVHDGGGFFKHGRPLGICLVPPGFEARRRRWRSTPQAAGR